MMTDTFAVSCYAAHERILPSNRRRLRTHFTDKQSALQEGNVLLRSSL
jgi:hypothetical protein